MKNVILLFAILLVISCKNKQEEQPATPNDEATDLLEQTSGDPILAELFELMQGSFNSEKQSLADSSYYNISLHMYPIWKDKGNFLYVEQALNSRQNNPYRQRVYEVARWDDTHLSSAVYTLPNDSLWIGKWRTPEAFDSITPNDLELREGCAVILQRVGDQHFAGQTNSDRCKSTLRGASYATSKVTILSDRIESWDQGFDSEGVQVWGAEQGGYVFDRINN